MATTYRQLVYLVLDELKLSADDSYSTEDHIIFLLSKYRGLLLKQQYKDVKKEIPEANFQTLCLDLIQVPAIAGEECEGGTYLRSESKIPFLINITTPKVYTEDFYQKKEITYISKDRMRYVGYNRWLPNIIYTSIGPDNYLYFKSSNPQSLCIDRVKLTGIFENPEEAAELECWDNCNQCDVLDRSFHLEEALIPQVVQLVVKELLGSIYKPEDPENDASDNLSDIATFLRTNVKSNLQKQIEG